MNEEIEEIEEKFPKTLTGKALTITGLICVIGLIIYLVFFYGIVIPTIYDYFLG